MTERKTPAENPAPQQHPSTKGISGPPLSSQTRERAERAKPIFDGIAQLHEDNSAESEVDPRTALAPRQKLLDDLAQSRDATKNDRELARLDEEGKKELIRSRAEKAIGIFSEEIRESFQEHKCTDPAALDDISELIRLTESELSKDEPDYDKIQARTNQLNQLLEQEIKKIFYSEAAKKYNEYRPIDENPLDSLSLLQGFLDDLALAQKETLSDGELAQLSEEEKIYQVRIRANKASRIFSDEMLKALEECFPSDSSARDKATELIALNQEELSKSEPDIEKVRETTNEINRIASLEIKKLFVAKTGELGKSLSQLQQMIEKERQSNPEVDVSLIRGILFRLNTVQTDLKKDSLDIPALSEEVQKIKSSINAYLRYISSHGISYTPTYSGPVKGRFGRPFDKPKEAPKPVQRRTATTEYLERSLGKKIDTVIKAPPERRREVVSKLQRLHILLALAEHPSWYEVRKLSDDCIDILEQVPGNKDHPVFEALLKWREQAEEFTDQQLRDAGFIVPSSETIRRYPDFMRDIERHHISLEEIPFTHRSFNELPQVTRVSGRWPIDVSFSHFMVWERLTAIGLAWEGIKLENARIRAEELFKIQRYLDTEYPDKFAPEDEHHLKSDAEQMVIALRPKFAALAEAKSVLENYEATDVEKIDDLEAKLSTVVELENSISLDLYTLQQKMQHEYDNRGNNQTPNITRALTRNDWNALLETIEHIEQYLEADRERTYQVEEQQERHWAEIVQIHRAVGKRMGVLANDAIDYGINEIEALNGREKRAFFHLCKGLFMGADGIAQIKDERDRAFYQELCGDLLQEKQHQNLADRVDIWTEQAGQFREGDNALTKPGEDGFGRLPVPARFLRACEDRIHRETADELGTYYPNSQDIQRAKEMYREVLQEVTPYSLLFDQLEYYRGPDRYVTEKQEYPDRDPFHNYVDIVLRDVIYSTLPENLEIYRPDYGETLHRMFNEYSAQSPEYRKAIARFGEKLFNTFRQAEEKQMFGPRN